MASYSLKLSIENCSQTAAEEDMVTTDSIARCTASRTGGSIQFISDAL